MAKRSSYVVEPGRLPTPRRLVAEKKKTNEN